MNDKEAKWKVECEDVGFEYIGRGTRSGYSQVKCMVCGGVGEYQQCDIRRGEVRCKHCHESKMREECDAAGFTWLGKVDGNRSRCSCNVCGHIDEYEQGAVRKGRVKCTQCHESKMRAECSAVGFTWLENIDGRYSKCSCNVCGHVDEYRQDNIRAGKVKCSHCQITKYQLAAKDAWEFINHFSDGRTTYVNIKHDCCEELVKVDVSSYLKGSYSCPHCMHSHFNDPSYFYLIQVGDIIKLGISNRPDHRYKEYGLPEDSTIIEHLRIPLETKRDALVVESHAKQLVKDFKLQTDIAKQVFTQSGFNECYSLESLEYLLTI